MKKTLVRSLVVLRRRGPSCRLMTVFFTSTRTTHQSTAPSLFRSYWQSPVLTIFQTSTLQTFSSSREWNWSWLVSCFPTTASGWAERLSSKSREKFIATLHWWMECCKKYVAKKSWNIWGFFASRIYCTSDHALYIWQTCLLGFIECIYFVTFQNLVIATSVTLSRTET